MWVAAVIMVFAGAVTAALVDRGGGMVYDSVLKVTWLQDWNLAGLHCNEEEWHPYCDDPSLPPDGWSPQMRGQMTWYEAKTWAKNLVYGGFDDWRLPRMRDTGPPGCDLNFAGGTDCGTNVQTMTGAKVYSEMAHLWYETLGNLAVCDPVQSTSEDCARQEGWGLLNVGPFQNMQTDTGELFRRNSRYWTGVPYNAPSFRPASWFFELSYGYQDWEIRPAMYHAVAVRSDVSEPNSVMLAMLALGLAAVARRKAS